MGNWYNRPLKVTKKPHAVFDLSNDYKSSFNFGRLIPPYVEECPPATKFLNLKSEVFLRFAPLVFPIMHRCRVRTNYFAVPFRLILGDKGYNDFVNGKKDIVPLYIGCSDDVETNNFVNTIFDYLGYDIPDTLELEYFCIPNPLAYLSYLYIWRCWYADEVLDQTYTALIDKLLEDYRDAFEQQSTTFAFRFSSTSDPEMVLLRALPVSYTKDYFTAAQVEPQRGDDVYLMNPLTMVGVTSNTPYSLSTTQGYASVTLSPGSSVQASGNEVLRTSDTINDFWIKEQIQRFRNIDNLFGGSDGRTIEWLAGHYGVISSDARMQLPQYIGGGEQVVQIQEVLQTSSDTESSPLGSMAGKGVSFGRTHNVEYFCEEHTFVLALLSVVPDNGYTTGNPRYFYKKNILDFALPEFNNVGYQSVYKGEIFSQQRKLAPGQLPTTDLEDWAYEHRYGEYRQHRSIATGDFRKSALLPWHMNRYFSALPPFNANFIHVNQEDSARIFNNADTDSQHIYLDVYTIAKVSNIVSYNPVDRHNI